MIKTYKKQDLEEVKLQLLAQKKSMEHELGIVAKKDPNVADGAEYNATYEDIGDEIDDNVHEVEQYQVNKSVEVSLERELRDINKALKNIEIGKYGICKYCDQPIPINRLKIRPTSSSCVGCKKTLKDEV